MFCPHCGKENSDGATYCAHCGKLMKGEPANQTNSNANKPEYNESKVGTGVLLGIFLSLLGLLIGVVCYPAGTVARKTFVKGWLIAFAIEIAISFFFVMFFMYGASQITGTYGY